MPTFEELKRSRFGDSVPLERIEDDTTVPEEERPPAPYAEGIDVTVNELLDKNPNITLAPKPTTSELQEFQDDEPLTSEQWFGYALGTTVELAAPLAGNLAYVKWLNRARAAAKITRPLKATPLGMLGFGAAELTLGALSNYANQKIKQHYKIQKGDIKISELMAAGVFNASPVVKVIDGLPVFKFLEPKVGSRIGARTIIKDGVRRTFVSGAAIGILESTFRQTASILLQEDEGLGYEEFFTDLAVSGGVGGTLNTALHGGVGLFSYWRSKGKRGRQEAVKLTKIMNADIVSQIDNINKEIQAEAESVGLFTNFAAKNAKIAQLKQKKKQTEEALELTKQLEKEILEENNRVDKAEAEPEPIKEPVKLTEEELDAPDERLREVEEEVVEEPKTVEEAVVEAEAPIVEEPTVVEKQTQPTAKEPETAIEPEPVKGLETPKPKAPTPKPKPLKRDGVLQSLVARTKAAFSSGEVPTIDVPNLVQESKKLYRDSISIFNRSIHTFRESKDKDIRALEIALDEVVFLQQLNQKVVDPLDTLMGRGQQSSRQDAAKYDYQTVLSERAEAERGAWADVEKSLRQAIENEADVTLYQNIQNALDVRPRFKELGDQLDRKATADYKRKLREATEKEPKEVPQELIISRLQQKLREAQQEFAGLKPEAKAKKAREKSEKEIDIQKRLDFYATGKREAKQIAQEENRLETYLELLEEGDIAKIRQQVGPAPDWTNKKAVGSYLATIRKVNNKTKKLLQKQVVESDISLQDPSKVAKAEAKKKARLQKRLKELRARAFQIEKIRPKDKAAKAEVNAEIEELERTVKFHEANERDALNLEKALKERARLLKVETGPLGAQRAEITKPKGPAKVPGELEKVNKDISFLKSNIRSRVKEIDKAALEMTDEFQAAKAEKEINKQISKLDDELQELRESFAKEPVEPGVKKPVEKDPRIKEREDKIAYYKEARRQIITLKKKYAERARLLELETGPLGAQRAEVTPKPTGPKKSAGIIAELDEQIAFLRRNMRKRVDEIDRARLEMTQEFQETKMLEAIRKRRAVAQKRLEARRARFADDDDLDRRAAEREGRNLEETDPVLLETNKKIKFYDKLEAEALKKKELREQLARQAEMEGKGIVSEIRAHLEPKPTGPKEISSNDELRRKIRESDSRMRAFLKDIDATVDSFRIERIYEATKRQATLAAQRDVETKVARFIRQWADNRVLGMIHQTSSVVASALGGISSSFKQFAKLLAEPMADLMSSQEFRGSQSRRAKEAALTFKANFFGLKEGLKNWKGTGRAVALTAKNLEGATGATGLNRLTGDISFGDPVKLLQAAEDQARRKRLRGEEIKGVQHIFARMPIGKMVNEFMKLPLRGIMPIDELFKRQLLRAELMSEAFKDAYKAMPNDPQKAAELAAEIYKRKWTTDQGLEILSQEGVNATATDTINKELLMDSNVANLDTSEIATPIADKILKFVRELRGDKESQMADALIHLLTPILTVVARGAGRSIRVGVPLIPATQARVLNPYNSKIKKVERDIANKDNQIGNEETTMSERIELQKSKEQLEQKLNDLKGRRVAYHRDAITDALVGGGMIASGMGAGAAGIAVGTLAWMTPEQKKQFEKANPKNKANTIEGWSYKEFFPLSIGFAIGADIAMYTEMREYTDDEGVPLLNKEQSILNLVINSTKELFKEVPVAGGIKSIEKLGSGDDDQMYSVLADWLSSFIFIPTSQIRKVLKLYFEDGNLEELRGGSFMDRTIYNTFGHNPTGNKKTDHFGHDEVSTKTPLNTFLRMAPVRDEGLNEFDIIYKKDVYGELVKPPKNMPTINSLDMYKFKDNKGTTLHYRFYQELKKSDLDQKVLNKIRNRNWRKKYEKGSEGRGGTIDETSVSNPALQDLNKIFNEAYKKTARNILKNKGNKEGTIWLDEFVSEDENEEGTAKYNKYGPNKTLRQVLDEAEERSVLTGRPISFDEVLKKENLDELLDANPQMQLSD